MRECEQKKLNDASVITKFLRTVQKGALQMVHMILSLHTFSAKVSVRHTAHFARKTIVTEWDLMK